MTTQQVASRYYELVQQGTNPEQIHDELYALDAVSIEPVNDSQLPREVHGLTAMRQKEQSFYQRMVEAIHGGTCSEPLVSSHHFACAMVMDVTLKGQPRKIMEQLGVFEVKGGKISKEEFFYNDFE